MSKKRRTQGQLIPGSGNQPSHFNQSQIQSGIRFGKKRAKSLLDVMVDGREYQSLVDYIFEEVNLKEELTRAVQEIEVVRQRPLLCYLANFVKPTPGASTSIDYSDDIPFSEAVSTIPIDRKEVDIMLVTPGGSAEQVNKFVNVLRPRFDHVAFILPWMAMSAGTIWAMSGDEIWMDERATIGPIDPQVPSKDGRFLPAQALITLVNDIQERGQRQISQGLQPNWTDIHLLNSIDGKELGNAWNASRYSIELVSKFLNNYKFKNWTQDKDGKTITPQERGERAQIAAVKLCDHAFWKSHGNGISRQDVKNECKIRIEFPETNPDFYRAIRRFWGLFYYLFEASVLNKIIASKDYNLMMIRSKSGG